MAWHEEIIDRLKVGEIYIIDFLEMPLMPSLPQVYIYAGFNECGELYFVNMFTFGTEKDLHVAPEWLEDVDILPVGEWYEPLFPVHDDWTFYKS